MNLRVAGGRVERTVPQDVGNELEVSPLPVGPCGPTVAEDVSAATIQARPDKRPTDDDPHVRALQRLAKRCAMSHKEPPITAGRPCSK